MNAYDFRAIEAFASRYYVRPDGQPLPLIITPYTYTLSFSNLTAGATALQTLTFQANADFILTHAYHFAVLHSTLHGLTYSSNVLPLARVLLTDSGSSQPLMNSAVALQNLSENGAFERGFPYPRFLSGRSSLQVQLTNYSDTEAYDIDIAFAGVNVQVSG